MSVESLALRAAVDLLPATVEASRAGEKLFVEAAKKFGIVSVEAKFPLIGDAEASAAANALPQITFKPNGTAIVGTRGEFAYRKTDDLFFTYSQNARPADIAASFRRGFLQNEDSSSFAPLNRSKPMVAQIGGDSGHRWDILNHSQQEALAKAVPDGSVPIGLGSKRQAWLTSSEHAVVFGPLQERANVPKLLQPIHREVLGDKQIEWFPVGESDSVTRADVKAVNHQIRMGGFHPDDSYTANYVRLKDGSVWRVDPEDLYPMSNSSWREYVANHSDGKP